MSKYRHRSDAWFDAIVDKLGGEKAADAFLDSEGAVSKPFRSWRKQDGVIRLSVTSNGMTGEEWNVHLESKGIQVNPWAKRVLWSKDFKPTSGITTNIAILTGSLFSDKGRFTAQIRHEAQQRKLTKPNPEVACLIRQKFTDKEIMAMGVISIITMHYPIEDSDRNPSLLATHPLGDARWLGACHGNPTRKWNRDNGFAFAAPPT